MEVHPKTVMRMLQFSETYNQPFTAAPYVSKGYDNEKAARVFARDLEDFHASTVRWNVVFEDPAVLTGQSRLNEVRNGFARAEPDDIAQPLPRFGRIIRPAGDIGAGAGGKARRRGGMDRPRHILTAVAISWTGGVSKAPRP